MATEKGNVVVELYDLTLTERADDRFGRVLTTRLLSESGLISAAVARRTDLNPVTLRASLDILKEVAVDEIANGASVSFGLGNFSLDVKGVFIGDHASWDPAQHSLHVRVTPSVELRAAVANAHVNVRGMAVSGSVINSVLDIISGETNARLTPGAGATIAGIKVKVAGDNPANGIDLTNQADGSVRHIAAAVLVLNEPKKVSFVVPADLPAGDYKLSITTQFTGTSTLLKEPRVCLLDYVLAVL
jgi:hypothetical protein